MSAPPHPAAPGDDGPGAIAALLLDSAARGVPEELLFFDDHWVARDDLVASARALGGLLAGTGAGAGQVVAGLLPNSPACAAALFGAWAAGATYAPLNPRLPGPELERILADLRPAVVLTAAGGPSAGTAGAGAMEVDGLSWRAVAPAVRGTEVDAGTALVLYTSGTTGRPKPVLLRRRTILSALDSVLGSLDTGRRRSEGDASGAPARRRMPNLVPFPLYLWSGVYNTCFALRVGSPIVAMSRFDPEPFAALVARFGIKSVVLAPAMMAALLASDLASLAPLRFVRNGTAPLPVSHARAFHARFGVAVLNGYGQTELGGEVVGWNAGDVERFGVEKLGSVGRPHPGIDVSFRDDAGVPVPPGDTGEVCVRSPFAMAGYLGGEGDDRVTPDGFLRTGDLGHVDPDGFVWLDGRRSDVINRSGLKVFPDEVEEVLRDDPAVADVAVVGMPDERVGEVPWAFVVHAPGAALDAAALAARGRERLAAYKVPARFVAVGEIPRNDVGKVLRRVLREQAIPEVGDAGQGP